MIVTLVCLPQLLGACASLAPFSEKAYEQATSLKLEIAYEFAKGRPRNEISARQWEILKDQGRNLLGGFFARWEERSTLPAAFVVEAKGLVSDAFDAIIGTPLEAFAV